MCFFFLSFVGAKIHIYSRKLFTLKGISVIFLSASKIIEAAYPGHPG